MKTKLLLLAMVSLPTLLLRAQITPSMSIPNPLPNYDGTYDNFGQGHLFYPNDGEIRFDNEEQDDASETVKYYTTNTYPRKFLLANNNLSMLFSKGDNSGGTGAAKIDSLHRIDIEWSGGNSGAVLARVDTQNFAKLNYFTQWFNSSGRVDVRGGAAIACQSIYSNIDMVYTSNNAGIVIYFIVYPGGNYNAIRFKINGAKSHSISSNKLKIDANWESMTFEKPEMYQYTISGSNVISPVNIGNPSWQSVGGDIYKFYDASSFNSSLPLIIQVKQAAALTVNTPGLLWSTYFGGSNWDFLTKTHTDANNNLYTAGHTSSTNFPQANGVTGNSYNIADGVIAKFNSSGVHQWSSFIGGSGNDEIHDFDFDGNSIYCVGKTASSDLSTLSKSGASNDASFGGGGWDAFIFEFQPSVNTFQNNWLRYFGGDGDEEFNACEFDSNGEFFVVGESSSTNLTATGPLGSYQQSFNASQLGAPNTPLSTDGIIAKFNTSSSQTWFTYFGTDQLNTNAHNHAGDYFYGITISGTDVYVCGKSGGTNLPNNPTTTKAKAGDFDGTLVRFTTSGALNRSKFTNGNISNYAVKTMMGDVYTVGQAAGAMTTVNSGLYYYNSSSSGATDACFSVHNADIGTTLHNTFLGGSDGDAAYDIQFNSNNLFYIAGGTNSSDFPTNNLSPMYYDSGNPNGAFYLNDNFISCFQKNSTSITWSSFLGSEWAESLQYPTYFNSAMDVGNTTIAIDSQNQLYALGWSGSYNTFPLDDGAGIPYFQATKNGFGPGGTNDGTITRFDVTTTNTIVGLEDFDDTEFLFGIYPNPTSDLLVIANPVLGHGDLQYAVYALDGKKVIAGTLKANDQKQIDINPLQQGVYIINVSNGHKTLSNKFVKVDR